MAHTRKKRLRKPPRNLDANKVARYKSLSPVLIAIFAAENALSRALGQLPSSSLNANTKRYLHYMLETFNTYGRIYETMCPNKHEKLRFSQLLAKCHERLALFGKYKHIGSLNEFKALVTLTDHFQQNANQTTDYDFILDILLEPIEETMRLNSALFEEAFAETNSDPIITPPAEPKAPSMHARLFKPELRPLSQVAPDIRDRIQKYEQSLIKDTARHYKSQ